MNGLFYQIGYRRTFLCLGTLLVTIPFCGCALMQSGNRSLGRLSRHDAEPSPARIASNPPVRQPIEQATRQEDALMPKMPEKRIAARPILRPILPDELSVEAKQPQAPYRLVANTPSAPVPTVIDIDQATFDEQVLQADVPVLVDFYASWCGLCKRMAPVLDQFAAENPHARVVKIDFDQNRRLADRYGIKSLPSLLVFHQGRLVAREKGVVDENRLKSLLTL